MLENVARDNLRERGLDRVGGLDGVPLGSKLDFKVCRGCTTVCPSVKQRYQFIFNSSIVL